MPIDKRLHICSYYCDPVNNIHAMPAFSEMTIDELIQHYTETGHEVVSIKRAEVEFEHVKAQMTRSDCPSHFEAYLVVLRTVLA